jgi:AraC-like DNA-binding protein
MVISAQTLRSLCRARELLAEVQEPSPSIEEVARAVAISPFHFIRLFQTVFGLTPHQFRIRSRLDRAKLLLASGQLSVTEVCMEVGFSSLGSFSELFRRRVGATPSTYQRRLSRLAREPGKPPPELTPGCLSLMGGLPPGAFRSFREA